jgi:hypothetical protein
MTPERKLDDASGTDADAAEMKALLAACLHRIHTFVLEQEAEPATIVRPEESRG